MVRRAYRDRPSAASRTPRGCEYYRGRVIDEGWSEAQVRTDLRRSEGVQDAHLGSHQPLRHESARARRSIVRRAYLSVLKREPDPASDGYVERVLRDGWSQADVERDLRRSAEYRSRIQ